MNKTINFFHGEKKKLLKQTNKSGCVKHYKEGPTKKAESDGGSNFTKVRGGLSEEMTFKQRPEGSKGMILVDSWKSVCLIEGK